MPSSSNTSYPSTCSASVRADGTKGSPSIPNHATIPTNNINGAITSTTYIPSGAFKLPPNHPVFIPIKKAAELHATLEPYLPMDRSPGQHVYEGVEMIMQASEDKRFAVIGLLAIASRVIKKLEKQLDQTYEGFVGEWNFTSYQVSSIVILMRLYDT